MTTAPKSRRRPDAFTLVELLVVIGIIAVLIAILLPMLNKARAAANRAVCLSNIRELGIGVSMYCDGNKGWLPTCAYAANGIGYIQYPDDWLFWQGNRNLDDSPIAKYLNVRGEKFKNLLRCPADTFDGRKARASSLPGQGPYLYSYYIHDAVGRNFNPYGSRPRSRITQWRGLCKKVLLTESLETAVLEPIWDYGAPLTRRHGVGISQGNAYLNSGAKMGTNVSTLFADGHAEGVSDDVVCNPSQYQLDTP